MKRAIWWGVASGTVLLVIYGIIIVLKAWWDTKHAPKKVMAMCDTHGPLMDNQTITFLDTPYCARCWFSKVKGE